MKVILIDPENQTVTVINIEKGNEAIYKAMDCTTFCCPIEYDNNDTLFADDEGLFKAQKGGVLMDNWEYPILGKILIIGCNPEIGSSIGVKSKVKFFTDQIRWVNEKEAEAYRARYN